MITLVAAVSKNNCIGKNNGLPWDIPEDMKRMREITKHTVLIMGRKTWESIPEKRRPLPNRTNVVITRNAAYPLPEGAYRFPSIEAALKVFSGKHIVGFGGTRIFADMIQYADALEITHVDQEVEGCDAFFPVIDLAVWKEVWREDHDGFAFVRYEKK